MKEGAVQVKSFGFTVRIVNLHKYLAAEKKEYVLAKQVLRSGTAIGALVREAEQAESKPDFVHKMAIALIADLGKPEEIGKVFAGFQKYLYQGGA